MLIRSPKHHKIYFAVKSVSRLGFYSYTILNLKSYAHYARGQQNIIIFSYLEYFWHYNHM